MVDFRSHYDRLFLQIVTNHFSVSPTLVTMWILNCLVILASTAALAGPLDTSASINSKPFIIIAQNAEEFSSIDEFSDQRDDDENVQIVTPSSSIAQGNIKKTTPPPISQSSFSSSSSSSSFSSSSSSSSSSEDDRILIKDNSHWELITTFNVSSSLPVDKYRCLFF